MHCEEKEILKSKEKNYRKSVDMGNKLQSFMQTEDLIISILVPRGRQWEKPQCSSEE